MSRFLSSSKNLLTFILVLILFPNGLNKANAFKIKCINNGTQTVEDGKLVCLCPHPFAGRYCEDYACVNGLATGDQYDSSSLFFNKRCLCDPGWTGELCDTSMLERCGENGKEQYGKCICKKNFVGERCQFVTKCTHGQLYNGRCSCNYGWSGDFCDKLSCFHGEPDVEKEICICPAKYRGKFCDFCALPASSPPPECAEISDHRLIEVDENFIKITLIIVIVIALIAVAYFLYRRFSRSKTIKKSRKTLADVENRLPDKVKEICPLKGGNLAKVEGENSEKVSDVPPPSYKVLAHDQEIMKRQQMNFDSGLYGMYADVSKISLNVAEGNEELCLETGDKDNLNKKRSIGAKLNGGFLDETAKKNAIIVIMDDRNQKIE